MVVTLYCIRFLNKNRNNKMHEMMYYRNGYGDQEQLGFVS